MWVQTDMANCLMVRSLLRGQFQKDHCWKDHCWRGCQELRQCLSHKETMMTHMAILKCRMATLKALPLCLTRMYCMCS